MKVAIGVRAANGSWSNVGWEMNSSGLNPSNGNAAKGFSIPAIAFDPQGNLQMAFDFGEGSYCNSLDGSNDGCWSSGSSLSFGDNTTVTPYSWDNPNNVQYHHMMAGIGVMAANGSWTDFSWFNQTTTGGRYGGAAEGFSISALAFDSHDNLNVAFEFGEGSYLSIIHISEPTRPY